MTGPLSDGVSVTLISLIDQLVFTEFNNVESFLFSDLDVGPYLLIFANNCDTYEIEIFIEEPEPLFSEFETYPVSCNGGSDGSVIVSFYGGVSPYSVSLGDLSTGVYLETLLTDNNVVSFEN